MTDLPTIVPPPSRRGFLAGLGIAAVGLSFTSLAGCGPGFLFHIMDGLCEAGVSVGLSRENSRIIAVELMGGCARLAEVTGKHPVILREQGTSPAGMTIAGLNLLDRTGVRGHLIEAVKTARDQGKVMDTQ